MTKTWTYSPDPGIETAVGAVARDHPPLFPDGFTRCLGVLERLGNPHLSLPPVFHAAGTNGKGSTLAFLQAAFRAGGLSPHAFISPHLVRFEERIVLNGAPVEPGELALLIDECRRAARGGHISFFEFFTVLGFLAYSRRKADALLLETGLGGLHDATNLIGKNIAVLTRISFDHTRILGDTLPEIAAQKAGIIKPGCPCVVAPQPGAGVMEVIEARAREKEARLWRAGAEWDVTPRDDGFIYESEHRRLALPLPALPGAHQAVNAATAIAALEAGGFEGLLRRDVLEKALATAVWPGRLQKLSSGPAVAALPEGWELWIDGAHNDSGAEVLVQQAKRWGADKPLHLLTMMKKDKDAAHFYALLRACAESARALDIPVSAPMTPVEELRGILNAAGFPDAPPAPNLESAVRALAFQYTAPARILVTGSLYLVGHILRDHH